MSVRETIRTALYDAIDWQASLVDAWSRGSPERAEAIEQIAKYRKILRRRYGSEATPDEAILTNARLLSLDELRALPTPTGEKQP